MTKNGIVRTVEYSSLSQIRLGIRPYVRRKEKVKRPAHLPHLNQQLRAPLMMIYQSLAEGMQKVERGQNKDLPVRKENRELQGKSPIQHRPQELNLLGWGQLTVLPYHKQLLNRQKARISH